MINKLPSMPIISQETLTGISQLSPLVGGEWDIKNNQYINDFKSSLRTQLLTIQGNKCAYCGLPFDETGKTEIEHFAPKGGPVHPKHPEFAFTIDNLVLACNLCNSPVKKGNFDTIEIKEPIYRNCTFKIVHPHLDNHDLHYEWPAGAGTVLIRGISDQGRESIRLFKLDSIQHTEARTRLKVAAYLDTIPGGRDLVDAALAYRP
ncbi:HNH endonuclease [Vibrio owensii]|uniref:HNH endonuclease n=1 Tax=Vibrio owensii TaxID=696485 RepID=UPI00039D4C44|nr:HNH endonuclease [Vibrio owensii]